MFDNSHVPFVIAIDASHHCFNLSRGCITNVTGDADEEIIALTGLAIAKGGMTVKESSYSLLTRLPSIIKSPSLVRNSQLPNQGTHREI